MTKTMKSTMKRIVLLPAVLLAGCQMLSYQPPQPGDNTATVTFTSNNTAAQPVVCVPGSGFQGTKVSLAHRPFDSHAFDEALKTLKKSEAVTVPVQAGDNTRIGVIYDQRDDRMHSMNRKLCKVAVQFQARPGVHYKAAFTYQNNQCGLSVESDDGADVGAVPVDWSCPN